MEDYILWLQIVMNDLLLLVCQVFESGEDLGDDQFGFFLNDLLVFFQIVIEVWPTAKLQDCTEAVVVDLNSVVMLHDASIVQLFMDLVLSQSMLDVVIFDLVTPTVVEVVNFAGYLTAIFQIEGLVDL